MKQKLAILLIACVTIVKSATAQDKLDNPGNYMNAIGAAMAQMNKVYMSYISAVAHNKRAKKIEKLRQQTVDAITNSKYAVIDLPIYKGDNDLRKSSIDYIGMTYKVFNEDYAHIVNMEDIAEQSVDAMQAYLLLQEKTNETLKAAYTKMSDAQKAFAAKYNVKMVDTKDDLSQKMDKANKVNHYHNQLYLTIFKCNWQTAKLMDALGKKKINDVEQSKSGLLKYAAEGFAVLDTTKGFEGDTALLAACRKVLVMYKSVGNDEVNKLSDYLLKNEEFAKTKKNYDAKAVKTKEDTDTYNNAIDQLNTAGNVYNKASVKMLTDMNNALTGWGNAENNFMKSYMP
ncbi:MAG: hypothetical protein J0I41_12550 [Filimonas sp.]|nr:hypothetical protein [Filimonas sp.]